MSFVAPPPYAKKSKMIKKYGIFHKRRYKIALNPFEQCPRMRKSRFPVWKFDSFETDKVAKACPEASEARKYLLCAGTKPQNGKNAKISEEGRRVPNKPR